MKGKKKVLLALASVAVVAFAAIGAYAYFTSTGTDTGTGTVGADTGWLVDGGSVVGTLYPDVDELGPDQGVITGAFVKNVSLNGGYQGLDHIKATITSVTSAAGPFAACAVTDFQFNSPGLSWSGNGTQQADIDFGDPASSVDLAPGASYLVTDLNVVMVDNGANQDRCKGRTVTVTLDAS